MADRRQRLSTLGFVFPGNDDPNGLAPFDQNWRSVHSPFLAARPPSVNRWKQAIALKFRFPSVQPDFCSSKRIIACFQQLRGGGTKRLANARCGTIFEQNESCVEHFRPD